MTPNPKVFGFKLPPTVEGGSSVSVTLCFPDLLEYRAAFNGQINMLGKWYQWAHTQADYQDIPEFNQQVAELWVQVLADAAWGVCMDFCEQMILCLTTDTDVQAALADLIATNPAVRAALSDFVAQHPNGTQYPIYQQVPAGASSGNFLPPNPDCDPDLLWAQAIGMVQTANRMTVDFLETWETYTNAAETIPAIVGAIPFVGEVADVIGVDAIADYANSLIDSIAENYAADYTLEYEQQLACEIFCAAKASCAVSIDDLCNILLARLSGQLNLANGLELMLSLIDADVSGINVADLYLAAFFNMLKLANLVLPITWGIESYTRTIAAFNEPNDDWEVYCTECPPDYEWRGYLINSFQPPDTNTGTAVDDGARHVVFTAGFSYGAYRIQQRLWDSSNELVCFKITSLTYPTVGFPNNLQCDGVLREGAPIVDECYLGIVAADLNPFTVEVTYERCI